MKLLLLEDDCALRESLEVNLRSVGYAFESASSASEALNLALSLEFDALICDVSLPSGPLAGFDVVRQLRSKGFTAPVLYVTGRDSLEDIIAGLDAGGDDYLLKPFRLPELLARLRALLRRRQSPPVAQLDWNDLRVDWGRRRVTKAGLEVHLTAKEFALLELLASQPGRWFSRSELLERIWDSSFSPESNLIEVYVRLLRRKLGDGSVENLRGRGYRFPDLG